MCDVQQFLVRDLGKDVSSKGEHADARDLLGMLDFKGGKTARSFVLRRQAFRTLESPGAWVLNSWCWLPLFRVWGARCVRVHRFVVLVGFRYVVLGSGYGL
jgi:hypothetical protein